VVPRVQTVAVAPEKARTKSAAFELHARKEMPRGAVYLFGEYANTGEVELGKPSVTVVFVAKDGKELGQGKGYAEVPSLPPGGRTPMSIFLKDPPAGCELRFVADAGWLDSRRQAAGLRVDAHPAARSFAMWKASGRVLNEGGSPAHWVGVVAVGRSAAGKVVGLGHAMAVLGDPLAPGGESRWEVPFLVAAEEPATFEYFAHGFVP
jgi:hypothetical protein